MAKLTLTGQRFGRWTVLEFAGNSGRNQRWLCRCDCGTERIVQAGSLKHGCSQSCGCLAVESRTKHGLRYSKEYRTWCRMKNRCYRPSFPNYQNYGGRGIRVCDEWLNDFAAFYAHVGPAPSPRHQIDRIDNEGHYAYGNVRWATPRENNLNRRMSRPDIDHKLVRQRYQAGGVSMEKLASEFDTCISWIWQIVHEGASRAMGA